MLVALSVFLLSNSAVFAEQAKLDVEAVHKLLDVLDAIMDKHADYASESARIDAMPETERGSALEAKASQNASDERINALIDTLHETLAYRMYFSQFRYTTREVHRRVLLALPYAAISSPGGISHNFKELCFHREAVRAWVDEVVGRIDVKRSRDVAEMWLPEGQYGLPPVHFVYDGSGDAFVQLGHVCFDLFGLVMRERPPAVRFEDLSAVDAHRIELVLAHEFHHVFARRLRQTHSSKLDDWRERLKAQLAERMVSEGVAMRCNVEGLRREVMEDPATLEFWFAQLNTKLAELNAGTLSEEQWQHWISASYQQPARERLKDFFTRKDADADIEHLMDQHAPSRPSLIYTLGWWMISRVLETPDGHQRVMQLLATPDRLFMTYNETVGDASALRVEF